MSKIRQNIAIAGPPGSAPSAAGGDLAAPPEGDLAPFVVFTQLRAGGPHEYAGWLDAVDGAMALMFAREHYGRDQECTSIWAIPRGAICGTDPEHAPSPECAKAGSARAYRVFVHERTGDRFQSAGTVSAVSGAEALRAAVAGAGARGGALRVWVVPQDAIVATRAGEVVWPLSDQSYRLARGYSKEVRRKWEQVREQRAITEYEKEDLKEVF
jgi:1,2-phenylacetyl-CoA epoxidase PaaB subunit